MGINIDVSTETKTHISHILNYGKPTPIACYTVRCPKCNSEKDVTTASILDGNEVAGTIQNPQIYLHSAKCKRCRWEYYF